MQKFKLIVLCVVIETMLIICVALANLNPSPVFYFIFYNLGYGMFFSFLFVLYFLRKENGTWQSVGIKTMKSRQFAVLGAYIVFSVGGQLVPKMVAGEIISWHLLPMGIFPLIMTTFFEEFLFRGYMQGRIEQSFGWLPAIIVSGLMFSLYHLGYPGFRSTADILLLFAVGLGFAIVYKLSDNNLFVSYFANLPNAFITYTLKNKQFPSMKLHSTIAAVVTLTLIVIIFCVVHKNQNLRRKENDGIRTI